MLSWLIYATLIYGVIRILWFFGFRELHIDVLVVVDTTTSRSIAD